MGTKKNKSELYINLYCKNLMLKSRNNSLLCVLLICIGTACNKDWLDAKPDKALTVPETLQDAQAMLDHTGVMNNSSGSLAESGADNYFIRNSVLSGSYQLTVDQYTWAPSGWSDQGIANWSVPYTAVFTANKVKEITLKIDKTASNQSLWDEVYGGAHFFRAIAFFGLSQEFALPYDASTAKETLGIPLRLEADLTQEVGRSSLEDTYKQILGDLSIARNYLPAKSNYKNRPTVPAVYGMLARIYLAMEDYSRALLYADSCLQLHNSLIDYNTIAVTATTPNSFPSAFETNVEIIFSYQMGNPTTLINSTADIDTTLYASYDLNDLRRSLFFRNDGGRIVWRGNYKGINNNHFNGLATDEMYLIRAECLARTGNKETALNDLNTLMRKRWNNRVAYPVIDAVDSEDALRKILTERRKELVYRGLRWQDLRRLNRDNRFKTTLVRYYNGQTYTLQPNDNKYAWPIPNNEVLISGIQQNPR